MQTHDLINQLSKDVKAVKPLASPLRRFSLWIFVASFLALSGVFILGALRGDLAARFGDAWFILESSVAFLIFVSSGAFAFKLSVPGEEPSSNLKWLPIGLVVLWTALLAFRSIDILSAHAIEHELGRGFGCSKMLMKLSLFPALILVWMVKKAAPLNKGWTGAMSLMSAAALGALSIQFMCPSVSALHVFFWHFLPVIGVAGAGVYVGRKLFRW